MAIKTEKAQLKSDEGLDPKGHIVRGVLHIGIGFNLERPDARKLLLQAGVPEADLDDVMKEDGKSISKAVIDKLFDISFKQARKDAETFANKGKGDWDKLPADMKNVLTNMSFQLGLTKLSLFTDTKKALDEGDFAGVASGILDSELARTQSPARAKRLVDRVAKISSTPKKEKFPFSFQEAFDLAYRDGIAERLSTLMPREAQIDRWADMLRKSRKEEELQAEQETAETAAPAAKPKPKLQKLEQGLFEDESGKKFFVDEHDKMFELDENNQPKVVIDPTQFDLSKVQDNSTPSPEEEIF